MEDYEVLFSESGIQFIVEVEKKHIVSLKRKFGPKQLTRIGVVGGKSLSISDYNVSMELNLDELHKSYNKRFN